MLTRHETKHFYILYPPTQLEQDQKPPNCGHATVIDSSTAELQESSVANNSSESFDHVEVINDHADFLSGKVVLQDEYLESRSDFPLSAEEVWTKPVSQGVDAPVWTSLSDDSCYFSAWSDMVKVESTDSDQGEATQDLEYTDPCTQRDQREGQGHVGQNYEQASVNMHDIQIKTEPVESEWEDADGMSETNDDGPEVKCHQGFGHVLIEEHDAPGETVSTNSQSVSAVLQSLGENPNAIVESSLENHNAVMTGKEVSRPSDKLYTESESPAAGTRRKKSKLSTGDKQQYQCRTCRQTFSSEKKLEQHKGNHENSFLPVSEARSIQSSEGDSRPHQCNVCEKSFKFLGHLVQHKKKHSEAEHRHLPAANESEGEGKSHVCKSCAAHFQSAHELSNHIKGQHIEHLSESCTGEAGGKSSNSSDDLTTHVEFHQREKVSECKICGKEFIDTNGLSNHKQTVPGKQPSACQSCSKGFDSDCQANEHLVSHVLNVDDCQRCGKAFSNKKDLQAHRLTHTEESSFECPTCKKEFKFLSTLKKHCKVHQEKKLACPTCTESFSTKQELRKHVKLHKAKKTYECSICGKNLRCNSHLKEHERIHTGEKPYVCNTCGKSFMCSSHLARHRRTHSGERAFVCQTCGKNFYRPCHLKAHMYVHTTEKPFVCETCGKAFTLKGNLITHQLIHTDERPHACDLCDKRFHHAWDLKVHHRVHSGERPYVCQTCGKAFKGANNLKTHEIVHSGARPYICSICAKGFKHSWGLKGHFKTHSANKSFTCELCGKTYASARILKSHQTKSRCGKEKDADNKGACKQGKQGQGKLEEERTAALTEFKQEPVEAEEEQ